MHIKTIQITLMFLLLLSANKAFASDGKEILDENQPMSSSVYDSASGDNGTYSHFRFGFCQQACMGFYGNKFKPLETGVEADYYFSRRFFAGLSSVVAYALMEKDGDRDWKQNTMYGLHFGYDVYHYNQYMVEIRAGIGDNFKKEHEDWDYFYYDLSARLYLGLGTYKGFLGLGARRYESSNDFYPSKTRGFVELGITWSL